jgi:hypothetical protein
MSLRVLNKPSDLFFAIGDAILAADIGVQVGNYDDFDGTVKDATVLIEFERTSPAGRTNDGRKAHLVTVTLHAVVARWRAHSTLEATNLAGVLADLAKDNRWGLPGLQCGVPQDLYTSPSMFQTGQSGYDAWGTTFTQIIGVGSPVLDDPTLGPGLGGNNAPFVAYAWEIPSVDDPGQYKQLEV